MCLDLKFYLLWIIILCSYISNSAQSIQSIDYWSDKTEVKPIFNKVNRHSFPHKYRTLRLHLPILQKELAKAPHWIDSTVSEGIYIDIPYPDGSIQTFEIFYAPIMHPQLAAKFPVIRSYKGIGVDDPTATIRFGLTYKGFHAMVQSSQHSTIFIDPYTIDDKEHYIAYYKENYSKSAKNNKWECFVDDVNVPADKNDLSNFATRTGDCQLRKYRLALACTGEYATFHGGNETDVMSAFTTTMARVNGIFERDASITMELVANTNTLIYYDGNTDPYTNNNGSAMLAQNQTVCDDMIGSTNYDIGHVFSTGGGGVAYLRSPCNNELKAGGVTGQNSPQGDPFDVDYVAHEMGHQYGANHTQNNNCNRSQSYEPGSASTIMGYAGICAPNVQSNSDDHFHVHSLFEMSAFVGGSCGEILDNNNNAPEASVPQTEYNLPISTPFVLTGIGSDQDNNALTYCWEQYDREVAPMPPQSTNTSGPAFRSISPTDTPERYFPNLEAIIDNSTPEWEVLPSVSRSMNFQLTVRDNHPLSGCTDEAQVALQFNEEAGPFLVTTPNTNVEWEGETPQNITWNVANTDVAPVNCANIDILLSTDGGLTYPIVLANNITNDGSHEIIVPNSPTTMARIRVQCSDNIFFDISNTNFTILNSVPGYFLTITPTEVMVCSPEDALYNIEVSAILDYSDPVVLSINNAPSGSTFNFSNNPVAPGQMTILTFDNIENVASGDYSTIELIANSTSEDQLELLRLNVFNQVPNPVTLSTPADNATNVSNLPAFTWQNAADATTYTLILASDSEFNNIIETANNLTQTSYQATTILDVNTTYYWQVIAHNPCGSSPISSRSFTTNNIICQTFTNNNTSNISSDGTPSISSMINIPNSGTITDVEVLAIQGIHSWIADLSFSIISPNNTEVTLLNRPCFNEDNFFVSFSDDTDRAHNTIPCPPTDGNTYQPNETLEVFNNQSVEGNWVLRIDDNANQDGGQLETWSLKVCTQPRSLPLEWLTFTAKAKGTAIQLDWTTASEVNNQGFEVLRSEHPHKNFESITWINSKANNSGQQTYTFLDKSTSPNRTYYYQLQQIDSNGQRDFSELVTARWQNLNTPIEIFPNPVKSRLHIRIPTMVEELQFKVLDALGQEAIPSIFSKQEGQLMSIDCQHLPQGLYFLQWKQDGKWYIQRFVVHK